MNRLARFLVRALLVIPSLFCMHCEAGSVGDPCTPENEYDPLFPGYEMTEVSTEGGSFQCQTRLCLVNHFEGRVTCPYGQTQQMASGEDPRSEREYCHVPGTSDAENRIRVATRTQFRNRPAADAVYCSCRCAGRDRDAPYCACPSGYECAELVPPNDQFARKELVGSYCVRTGTLFEASIQGGLKCTVEDASADPPGACGSFTGPD